MIKAKKSARSVTVFNFICLTVALGSQVVFAQTPQDEQGKKLLEKAYIVRQDATTHTYSVTTTPPQGKPYVTKFYSRSNPDGTVDKRSESNFGGKTAPLIKITNRAGSFQLLPDEAIDLAFQNNGQDESTKALATQISASAPLPDALSYEVKQITYDDKAAYQITQRATDKGNAKFKELMSALGKASSNASMPVSVYVIDKSDYTILRMQTFSIDGDLLGDIKYENVQTNLPLADDLFEIPKKLKIVRPENIKEFGRIMGDFIMGSKSPPR